MNAEDRIITYDICYIVAVLACTVVWDVTSMYSGSSASCTGPFIKSYASIVYPLPSPCGAPPLTSSDVQHWTNQIRQCDSIAVYP